MVGQKNNCNFNIERRVIPMADENRVNFFTSNTFRPISDEEIEEIGKSVNPGEVGDLYGSMTEDDIDEIIRELDEPVVSRVRMEPGQTNTPTSKVQKTSEEDTVPGEGQVFYENHRGRSFWPF